MLGGASTGRALQPLSVAVRVGRRALLQVSCEGRNIRGTREPRPRSGGAGTPVKEREKSPAAPAPPGRAHLAVAAVFLSAYATLLFAGLGHHPLWDDEANTALFAEAVWNTGDTVAVLGHNVVAYRNGYELEGLANRFLAPLQYYLAAPFAGLGGRDPWVLRLPFALLGLATAALAVFWMWRRRLGLVTWILVAIGFLGNVSLLLFDRQVRYFAPVVFLSLAATYFHVERDGRAAKFVGFCLSSALLLATHYLAYAALVVTLGLDYLFFGRRERALTKEQLFGLAGSQAAVGIPVLWVWFPLGHSSGETYVAPSWVLDKLTLIYWSFRDLNTCEFGVGLLLLAAPLLHFTVRRDPALWRIPLGIAVYLVAIALFSPQPVGWGYQADVRYFIAVIPAAVFVGARALQTIPRLPAWGAVALGLILAGTNLGHAPLTAILPGPAAPPLRSTLFSYVRELRDPPPSPYRAASEWLQENVKPGESVFVVPDYATYPLMFHAPHPVYAWQFKPEKRAQYPTLADIHFVGRGFPDYIVLMGPEGGPFRPMLGQLAQWGVVYRPVARIPVYGKDMSRPELHWHSFEATPLVDARDDGITVFARGGGS